LKEVGKVKSNPLIYNAGLTYSTTVYSSDTFPIDIGYVTAYAQKNLPNFFDFKLFLIISELLIWWNFFDTKLTVRG